MVNKLTNHLQVKSPHYLRTFMVMTLLSRRLKKITVSESANSHSPERQLKEILELSHQHYSRLKTRNHVDRLFCYRCGGEVLVGSRVHVQRKRHGGAPVRVYHEACYLELFYDL